MSEINNIKQKLKEIEDIKTKGAIIRSKVAWAEEGQRSTKYFLGLGKDNYKNKTVSSLISPQGKLITKSDKILKEENIFYESLYTSQNICLSKVEKVKYNNLFFDKSDKGGMWICSTRI